MVVDSTRISTSLKVYMHVHDDDCLFCGFYEMISLRIDKRLFTQNCTDSFLCPSIVETCQHTSLIWTEEVRDQVQHTSGAMRIEGERSLRILTGLIGFQSPGILEKNRARTEDNREILERMIFMEDLKMLPLVATGASMSIALE